MFGLKMKYRKIERSKIRFDQRSKDYVQIRGGRYGFTTIASIVLLKDKVVIATRGRPLKVLETIELPDYESKEHRLKLDRRCERVKIEIKLPEE